MNCSRSIANHQHWLLGVESNPVETSVTGGDNFLKINFHHKIGLPGQTRLNLFADLFISVDMEVEDSDPAVTRDQGEHRAGVRGPGDVSHLDRRTASFTTTRIAHSRTKLVLPLLKIPDIHSHN